MKGDDKFGDGLPPIRPDRAMLISPASPARDAKGRRFK
jgi:hypothetical protein